MLLFKQCKAVRTVITVLTLTTLFQQFIAQCYLRPPSLMVFFFLQNPNRFESMRMMNRWRDTLGVCCQVPKLATLPPFLTMGSADFCLFLCFTKIKSQNCSANTLIFKSSLPKFVPMPPFPTIWSADICIFLYWWVDGTFVFSFASDS